jgi:hypothetical protein
MEEIMMSLVVWQNRGGGYVGDTADIRLPWWMSVINERNEAFVKEAIELTGLTGRCRRGAFSLALVFLFHTR